MAKSMSISKGARAYAHHRRTENRAIREQETRNKMKTANYLRQIEKVCEILEAHWKTLSSEQIQALKLHADVNFRRLAKVLPDLRAVDITSAGEQIDTFGVAVIQPPPNEKAWIAAATGKIIEQNPDDGDGNE